MVCRARHFPCSQRISASFLQRISHPTPFPKLTQLARMMRKGDLARGTMIQLAGMMRSRVMSLQFHPHRSGSAWAGVARTRLTEGCPNHRNLFCNCNYTKKIKTKVSDVGPEKPSSRPVGVGIYVRCAYVGVRQQGEESTPMIRVRSSKI